MDTTQNGRHDLRIDLDAFLPQTGVVTFAQQRFTVTKLRSLPSEDTLRFLDLDQALEGDLPFPERVRTLQQQVLLLAPALAPHVGRLSLDQITLLRDQVLGIAGPPTPVICQACGATVGPSSPPPPADEGSASGPSTLSSAGSTGGPLAS